MKSLPNNNLGSRIVRTTRIFAIAKKWGSDPYYDCSHEFFVGQERDKEWLYRRINIATRMAAMKGDLVRGRVDNKQLIYMCGGMPLAVLCMLSAVAKEREKQGEHANTCDVQDEIEKHVLENGIQNTPGFEPLVESLQLGFDDLPHHMLKTCLLYCSICPDDHSFQKNNLVRRWISEGFVYTEEEGNSYGEELLNRGLIVNTDGHRPKYKMHPMMRNFLRWKSRQDNFIACISEITPSSRIRRLCICSSPRTSRDATGDPLSALDWCHIRSLVVSEGIERVPFEKLEGLRVLDLCWIRSLLDHHWKGICGLVRLRHLSGLTVSEHPPEIVRLQCFETFEAEGGEVASGFIGNLQELKNLKLRGAAITELPSEIVALQQLQTLRIKSTCITKLPKEIGELHQLKILDISNTKITVLPKEIGELHQLKILDIRNTKITVLPKEIGELRQLKILDISNTKITVLPKVIGELQQLKTLDISHAEITVLPKEIGKLQKLEHLLMVEINVSKIPREIGALKKLKTFMLRDSTAALPLEVCAFVELPESIHQALSKSELAGEMLSFKNPNDNIGTGGLVVGAKQMHIPHWIGEHFNDLALLDIRICKLDEQGLKILREMPKLVDLTLRFEVVPREPIAISSQGFAKLWCLTVDSRVPRITFQEGAMPAVTWLTFLFQFYAGPPYKDPMGINHLRELWSIKFECNKDWYGGGDSPCIRPTIDVVKKEARELSRACAAFKFQVCGREESIHSPPPSPPPPLEMGQQREMEQGETEEEDQQWSSGECEIEEDIEA